MARRTFDVIDVTEILVHWHAGRSLNEMSQSLGVDRKTIRKYIAPAVAAGAARSTSVNCVPITAWKNHSPSLAIRRMLLLAG